MRHSAAGQGQQLRHLGHSAGRAQSARPGTCILLTPEPCCHRPQVVGDDLLVTNPKRVKQGIDGKWCNALLLKVNQIGSLTESINAVRLHPCTWTSMRPHHVLNQGQGQGLGRGKTQGLCSPCRVLDCAAASTRRWAPRCSSSICSNDAESATMFCIVVACPKAAGSSRGRCGTLRTPGGAS